MSTLDQQLADAKTKLAKLEAQKAELDALAADTGDLNRIKELIQEIEPEIQSKLTTPDKDSIKKYKQWVVNANRFADESDIDDDMRIAFKLTPGAAGKTDTNIQANIDAYKKKIKIMIDSIKTDAAALNPAINGKGDKNLYDIFVAKISVLTDSIDKLITYLSTIKVSGATLAKDVTPIMSTPKVNITLKKYQNTKAAPPVSPWFMSPKGPKKFDYVYNDFIAEFKRYNTFFGANYDNTVDLAGAIVKITPVGAPGKAPGADWMTQIINNEANLKPIAIWFDQIADAIQTKVDSELNTTYRTHLLSIMKGGFKSNPRRSQTGGVLPDYMEAFLRAQFDIMRRIRSDMLRDEIADLNRQITNLTNQIAITKSKATPTAPSDSTQSVRELKALLAYRAGLPNAYDSKLLSYCESVGMNRGLALSIYFAEKRSHVAELLKQTGFYNSQTLNNIMNLKKMSAYNRFQQDYGTYGMQQVPMVRMNM